MKTDTIEAIPAPRVVFVVIAGQRFPFRLTINALHDLENSLSGSVFDFIQALIANDWPAVRLSDAARVLWAGCAHMGRHAPTDEECFNALVHEGANTSIRKLLEPLCVYVNGASEQADSEEGDGEKKQ